MKSVRSATIVALTVACTAPAPPKAMTPVERRESRQPVADWLEPILPDWDPRAVYSPGREAVLGNHLTLVSARIGIRDVFVGVHDERGVMGFFSRGTGVRWVGVDGDDAIYQVDEAGHVVRATFDAAMSDSWEERAPVPGAQIWTASSGVLGAAVDDTLYVSTDGARTFHPTKPAPGSRIAFLGSRPDGVIVVQVRKGAEGALRTLISSDRGEHFSSTPRVPELTQVGAWIFSRCARAVLSSDGKTWVRVDDVDALGTPAISQIQDGSADPGALVANRRVSLFEPPAPPPHPDSVLTGDLSCSGSWHVTRRVHAPNAVDPGACVGVSCLDLRPEPSPYPTRTQVILLRDGACPAEHADTTGRCRPDAPVLRAPHALFLDHQSSTARVSDLPSSCRPGSVRSAGGLAVLSCREVDGTSSLYAATRTEPWRREANFHVPLTAESTRLQVAGDGTLLFEDRADGLREISAWVRSPMPVGAPGAWRELHQEGARAYSVTRGNGALVTVSEWGRLVCRIDRGHVPWLSRAALAGSDEALGRRALPFCPAFRLPIRLFGDARHGYDVFVGPRVRGVVPVARQARGNPRRTGHPVSHRDTRGPLALLEGCDIHRNRWVRKSSPFAGLVHLRSRPAFEDENESEKGDPVDPEALHRNDDAEQSGLEQQQGHALPMAKPRGSIPERVHRRAE